MSVGADRGRAAESILASPITVLLVEDNPGDVRLLRLLLDEMPDEPVRLEVVERLSLALARLVRGGVDVLLLDLDLPDTRGVETYLRAREAAPAMPVVVLSGRATEKVAAQLMYVGVRDYLVKGRVDAEGLVRALRSAQERQAQHAAPPPRLA